MWIEAISGGGVTPTPITPSNTTPASMTSGTAYEPTANGYAISSYASKTPSSTPEYLYSGHIYKLTAAGWIIDGWGDVTPTPEGTYFASGMRKMSSSGYAYSQKPSVTDFPEALWDTTSTTSHSFAASLTGTYILLLVFQYSTSSSLAYNRFDDTTATGATLTKIDNMLTANANVAGTFFLAHITSNNVTISTGTKNSRVVSFKATI